MRHNSRATATTTTTHGGSPAVLEGAEKELTRTVSACLLFEDAYYESGSSIAKRIDALCEQVSIEFLCNLAVKARTDLKLRHAPLYLMTRALPKKGTDAQRKLVGDTITHVIERADELAEIIAMYWRDGRKPLPRQLKRGIAQAFHKFDAYDLAKYNRDYKVKLRDALFLSHAKPSTPEQVELWKNLANDTLPVPDTWEVALSAGKDKKETFERLLAEHKLGALATLRNVRNMLNAGVPVATIEATIVAQAPRSKLLPFRYIAAAQEVPQFEASLDKAIVAAASALPKIPGRTLIVVDRSGSMTGALSGKTRMSRLEAANGLAMLAREQCEDVTIYATAGNDGTRVHATQIVPLRHAFALRDAVNVAPIGGGGIFLKQCMEYIQAAEKGRTFDRVIVITDEQDCDNANNSAAKAPKLGRHNYIVNVGVYTPALPVASAGWTRVSGFSERVLEWCLAEEASDGVRPENA